MKLRRKPGTKNFFIQAWLRENETSRLTPFPLSQTIDLNIFDQSYPFSRIPALLALLLTDIADHTEDQKVNIEFFVPCELFDKDFDNWEIDNHLPLGMRYQLFIRAAEREKMNNAFWKEKCTDLHRHIATQQNNLVHWIETTQDYDTNIRKKIAADLSKPDIIGLAMTICPSHFTSLRAKQQLFGTLVLSGIPIAFWPRHLASDPTKLHEAKHILSSLLERQRLSKLPDLIQEQRRNAQKSDSYHVGHHLTLFWDEWETRLPPIEKRLQEIVIRSY